MQLLNKNSKVGLSSKIEQVAVAIAPVRSELLHIGVGGFHRSHQAYAIQKLMQLDAQAHARWHITGVCMMPSDETFVRNFKKQDQLYHLKMSSPTGEVVVELMQSISSILFAQEDAQAIVARIGDPQTKVISFTITEGGYNINFERQEFRFDEPAIQHDLQKKGLPKSVFGFLAQGLALRKANQAGPLTLLSCDNIQENGDVLQFALKAFLQRYDPSLFTWVEAHCAFPNSMVDRITPHTTEAEKAAFEQEFAIRDQCLVVSEDYFQWVIADLKFPDFPDLQAVGVEMAQDVRPYEAMKISILNGGHTLVGLLGDALGYRTIHEAVLDSKIDRLYTQYIQQEVMDTLEQIEHVDFNSYFHQVKKRFSNAMINDRTDRIISGSSDKIPKFVLPILSKQSQRENAQVAIGLLIVLAWWHYLNQAFSANRMANVQDNRVEELIPLFEKAAGDGRWFLHYQPIFGNLGKDQWLQESYHQYLAILQEKGFEALIDQVLNTDK